MSRSRRHIFHNNPFTYPDNRRQSITSGQYSGDERNPNPGAVGGPGRQRRAIPSNPETQNDGQDVSPEHYLILARNRQICAQQHPRLPTLTAPIATCGPGIYAYIQIGRYVSVHCVCVLCIVCVCFWFPFFLNLLLSL